MASFGLKNETFASQKTTSFGLENQTCASQKTTSVGFPNGRILPCSLSTFLIWIQIAWFAGLAFSWDFYVSLAEIAWIYLFCIIMTWCFLRDGLRPLIQDKTSKSYWEVPSVALRGCVHLFNTFFIYIFLNVQWDLGWMIRPVPFRENLLLDFFYILQIYQWCVDYFQMIWSQWGGIDRVLMRWHHVTTVLLLLASFQARYLNVGLLILFIHELTDILVSLSKVLKCINSKFLPAVFVANFFIWIYFRIYLFSTFIIWPITHYLWTNPIPLPIQLLSGALVVLEGMHIYWTGLMASLIYRMLRSSPSEASRFYDKSPTPNTDCNSGSEAHAD